MVKFVHNYKYENEFKFLKLEDPMFHVSLIYLVKSLLNEPAPAKGCQIKSTGVYIYISTWTRILVLTISEKEVRERSSKEKLELSKSRSCEKVKCIFAGETTCKVAARNSNVASSTCIFDDRVSECRDYRQLCLPFPLHRRIDTDAQLVRPFERRGGGEKSDNP